MTYIVLALISAFFWASSSFLLKIGLRAADPIFSATIHATIANFFLIIAYIGIHGIAKQDHVNFSGLSFIILAGFAGGLSWLFYIQALKHGPLTHVASIEPTNFIFLVLMGGLLLGEWQIQYFIGAILIAIGTCLVTL
jgi:transporter family protein